MSSPNTGNRLLGGWSTVHGCTRQCFFAQLGLTDIGRQCSRHIASSWRSMVMRDGILAQARTGQSNKSIRTITLNKNPLSNIEIHADS